MQYLGVTITEAERKELEQMERPGYQNPYQHYGFHTHYGIEEKEIYIQNKKENVSCQTLKL